MCGAFGAAAATVSILLTLIWGVSRTVFAMARNADLPPPLARLTGGGIPAAAVVLVGVASAVLAAVGSVPALIAASAFTILVYYAAANVCALLLPREAPARKALYVAGLAACVLLSASLRADALRSGATLCVVALACYPLRWLWITRGRTAGMIKRERRTRCGNW
jgi:APA family basic amino acid/polyamine antiporter